MKFSTTAALSLTLSLLTLTNTNASPQTQIKDLSKTILTKTRQTLNLSNLFGSPTSIESYERISSQPVFSVTTPWGSPYLLFERTDRTESELEFDEDEAADGKGRQDNTKQVALYFMDEEDAMRLRDEMLQMDQMKGADMRITAFSLGKAIAQSTSLHKGLLTGQAIDDHSGKMKGPEEGGVLRYKIVPPKRELFYAARCKGRERVGLWGANAEDDARLMMQSVPVIGGTLANMRKNAIEKRRRDRKNAKLGAPEASTSDGVDPIRNEYKHMEGFVGIPVFHCPQMKKYNKVKGLLRNDRKKQNPLYFSYEDLVSSYEAMRNNSKDPDSIPDTPDVEVYNLMDVVTSIDREQWRTKRAKQLRTAGIVGKIPVINKITGKEGVGSSGSSKGKISSGLEQVVFVPNSKGTKFKESVSALGNSQARLPRMRPWGKDM
jgi:hypothetical protein